MTLNIERLKKKWKANDGQARLVKHNDLRQGRPAKPKKPKKTKKQSTEPKPEIGSPCQRCGKWTEEITCVYLDYWLCSRCAGFHNGLRWRFGTDKPVRGREIIIVQCYNCGQISSMPLEHLLPGTKCFNGNCRGLLHRERRNEQRIAESLGQYEARFGFLPFQGGGL